MLADAPADIQAREVAHRVGPHGKAEFLDDGIDILRHRAFQQQAFRLRACGAPACGCRRSRRNCRPRPGFCQQLAGGDRGGDGLMRGFGAAHDFQQLHDIGGREEMHAHDILRPGGGVARWRRHRAWRCWRRAGCRVWRAGRAWPKISFFRSRFSNTASMTMSVSAITSQSVVPAMRATRLSMASASSAPRSTET